MDSAAMREQLHQYLKIADDKKVNAIPVILEESIKDIEKEYTDEFKAELHQRVEHYLSGGQMVGSREMNNRILEIRKKIIQE